MPAPKPVRASNPTVVVTVACHPWLARGLAPLYHLWSRDDPLEIGIRFTRQAEQKQHTVDQTRPSQGTGAMGAPANADPSADTFHHWHWQGHDNVVVRREAYNSLNRINHNRHSTSPYRDSLAPSHRSWQWSRARCAGPPSMKPPGTR